MVGWVDKVPALADALDGGVGDGGEGAASASFAETWLSWSRTVLPLVAAAPDVGLGSPEPLVAASAYVLRMPQVVHADFDLFSLLHPLHIQDFDVLGAPASGPM